MIWLLVLSGLFVYFRPKQRIPIENRKIVILGASSGIGKQLGLEFAKKNHVILVARRIADLKAIQKEILELGGQCDVFQCDWTDSLKLSELVEFVKSKGGLDHLILCAGIMSTLTFEKVTERPDFELVLDSMFKTNSYGPILAAKEFLPQLIESQGMITVISSAAGVMAAPTRALYSATKHAITGFFRALRIELESKSVDVCIVMPGSVQTDLRHSSIDGNVAKDQSSPKKGMTVQLCTKKIMEAMERRDREVHLPRIYQLGAILVNLFPEVIDFLAKVKYGYK
jgi:dehydrogenase/reductase SDR family protein 7